MSQVFQYVFKYENYLKGKGTQEKEKLLLNKRDIYLNHKTKTNSIVAKLPVSYCFGQQTWVYLNAKFYVKIHYIMFGFLFHRVIKVSLMKQ